MSSLRGVKIVPPSMLTRNDLGDSYVPLGGEILMRKRRTLTRVWEEKTTGTQSLRRRLLLPRLRHPAW